MKTYALLIATILMSSVFATGAQAQARVDEAQRLSCETTMDGISVQLDLYETVGGPGDRDPYGVGRYTQKMNGVEMGSGKLLVENKSSSRVYTLKVIDAPTMTPVERPETPKFAEFEVAKRFHGDIEIRALNMNNQVWGNFHCVGHN